MLTAGGRFDRQLRNKTKSVTSTQQHERKSSGNKPSKSRSGGRDKENKPPHGNRRKDDNSKLVQLLRKTLSLLTKLPPSDSPQSYDPLTLAESLYNQAKQITLRQRDRTHETHRNPTDSSSTLLGVKPFQMQDHDSINRSNILHYFKQKFGSPANDEKSMQKKLKALNILKRSQDMASRYHSRSIESPEQEESLKVKKNSIFIEKLQQKMRM